MRQSHSLSRLASSLEREPLAVVSKLSLPLEGGGSRLRLTEGVVLLLDSTHKQNQISIPSQ